MGYEVKIGLSNKHLHLCQADMETLFGKGHNLTPKKGVRPARPICLCEGL